MRAMALSILPLLLSPLKYCHFHPDSGVEETGGNGGGETDSDDSGHSISGDSGDELDEGATMTVRGTVNVQVYTTDADGELVLMTFDEAYGGAWSYGNIFVAAYNTSEEGRMMYYGDTAILGPSTSGNPYEMEVRAEGVDSVNVYAALDLYGEGVIGGSSDPVGVFPDPIPLEDGMTVEEVDITIMAVYLTGGGGSCDGVTVSGQAVITIAYAGGDVAVFANDLSNDGPRHSAVSWVTPEGGMDGASAAYSLFACAGDGASNLVGGWDSNGNSLLDPLDKWGAYVSEPDLNGNPVEIGAEDLSGLDVQIPLGADSPFTIVPYVRLGGNISFEGGGSFSTLPEGSTLYVAALKYRPDQDIEVEDLEAGYDLEVYEWDQLQGHTEIGYSLKTPANSIAYLWAYVDTDGDGVINESGEPVGSGGSNSNGRVATGVDSQDDLNIALMMGGGE